VSGAKSDPADAHILADMVHTHAHQLRSIAADSSEAHSIKVVARVHKTLIRERTRHVLRLRHALREHFPAALEPARKDLDAADTLELLSKAPDPASAAKLNRSRIRAALKHAHRRDLDTKTTRIQAVLRSQRLGRDWVITGAYAASTRPIAAVLATLNEQITALSGQVEQHFVRHPRR
jgi:transposase